MKAGPIWPYSTEFVTSGKVFPSISAAGREGIGVMANLDGDSIVRMGFDLPPVVPTAGDAKLRISAIATVGGAATMSIEPKWKAIAFGGARTSLSTGADDWTVTGGGGAPNEFYYNGTPPSEPAVVYVDHKPFEKGAVATLTDGQWGWGDADTLGASTVYVFDGGDDPDDSGDQNYVRYSGEGEDPSTAVVSEGIFTFNWTAAGDADKWLDAYFPLDQEAVVGAEEISLDLTFLNGSSDPTVVSTYLARIVFEENT